MTPTNDRFTARAYIISELNRYYSNVDESRFEQMIEQAMQYAQSNNLSIIDYQFIESKCVGEDGRIYYQLGWQKKATPNGSISTETKAGTSE